MFPLLPAMPEEPGKLNLSQLLRWLQHRCYDAGDVRFHIMQSAPPPPRQDPGSDRRQYTDGLWLYENQP